MLLASGKTKFTIDMYNLVEQALKYYAENMETLDKQINAALTIPYTVKGSYSSTGRKISEILGNNNVFIDCNHMNQDLFKIVADLLKIIQVHNVVLHDHI